MPLIYQKFIHRVDLRNNPNFLYLFGDNEQRAGYGGQAGQCRGEPNAVGVATKRSPSTAENAYWSDENYDHCTKVVLEDLDRALIHLQQGHIVVCPSDGLGTGLSELPKRAPRVLAFIEVELSHLRNTYK